MKVMDVANVAGRLVANPIVEEALGLLRIEGNRFKIRGRHAAISHELEARPSARGG